MVNRSDTTPSSTASAFDVQELWRAFCNAFFITLHFCVFVTFCYVVFVVIPMLHGSSEALPGMPRASFAMLIIHAVTAVPALVIGLIAFNPYLRKKSIGSHRVLGDIYCICIWISSVTGILLATANRAGLGAQMGFAILGIVWFVTTSIAYSKGRSKNIPSHRIWMIRSYATTLAVVTVRPLLWGGPADGFTVAEWTVFISWACWVPNIILAEIYIRITTFSGKLALPKKRNRPMTAN